MDDFEGFLQLLNQTQGLRQSVANQAGMGLRDFQDTGLGYAAKSGMETAQSYAPILAAMLAKLRGRL